MGSDASKQTNKTTANIFRLLCDGYIRNIETELHPKFIPFSIYYICYKFYHYSNYIFYLSQNHKLNPNKIYITDLDIDNNNKQNNCIKCNIIPLQNSKNNTDYKWDIVNAGIYHQKHFSLPTEIIKQIENESQTNIDNQFNDFDIIFKCGGRISSSQTPNNTCMALIIDSNNKSQIYYWQLPSLPHPTCGNYVLYSNKYGLLSIGGEIHNPINGSSKVSKNISNLLFCDNCNYNNDINWKWNNNKIIQLNEAVYQPSCVMISNDKFAVIGGRYGTARKSVEIYNMKTNKYSLLKDINFARYGCGIYFDECYNRIYLGGGCEFGLALNSIEYYDLYKSIKWNISLPNTNMVHDYYPIIWSDLNNSLLYIASVNSNSIESIDIRMNNKSWIVMYGGKHKIENKIQLQDLFKTQFVL
eukprot:314283_1